ncbi:MAG: hypothetical protein IPK83_19670 [Planctomycetes bacterium]|nr:hypothetical protein [Planctomycetota bacterium]
MQDIAADMRLRLHLFSSNGIERGGIHGWMFFDRPLASERVFSLLKTIVGGQQIETFPKQPSIPPTGFGNWMRVFGRHYKRAEWARYWGGRGWLTAEQTIDAILRIEPDDADLVPQVRQEIRITSRPIYRGHRRHFAETAESLQSWLESKGVTVKAIKPCHDGSTRLILGLCPFHPDHGDGPNDTSVVVFWTPSGPRFCCQHNRCKSFKWRDLRAKLDPDYVPHDLELTPINWESLARKVVQRYADPDDVTPKRG